MPRLQKPAMPQHIHFLPHNSQGASSDYPSARAPAEDGRHGHGHDGADDTVREEGYNPEAVMAVLKTEYYRELMYSHARGSTPSRYRLNREDMLKLPFPDIRSNQEQIAVEANNIREQVKNMRIEAELKWKAAKEQFEKELLEG